MHARAETEKTTFSCKDDCTFTKHTRRWTYSTLRYFLTRIRPEKDHSWNQFSQGEGFEREQISEKYNFKEL